jgi:hypothetical protein
MPKDNTKGFTEDERKYFEIIQNVIARMNTCSFQIKGMTVAVVTALLAVHASNSKPIFLWMMIVPVMVFWLLDSYYLCKERQFRKLYEDVTNNDGDIILYSMQVEKYKSIYSCCKSMFSLMTFGFYVLFIILGLCVVYFQTLQTTHESPKPHCTKCRISVETKT